LPGSAFGADGAYVAEGKAFNGQDLPLGIYHGRVEGHGPAARLNVGFVGAPPRRAAEFYIYADFHAFDNRDQSAVFGVGDVKLQGRVRKVGLAVVRVGELLWGGNAEQLAEMGSGGFEPAALGGYEEAAGASLFAGREQGLVGQFEVDEPDADSHWSKFNGSSVERKPDEREVARRLSARRLRCQSS
jgi:hypothetical protein